MTKEKLDAFFSSEERSGERKINLVRLAAITVFFLNELFNFHVLGVVEPRLHLRAVRLLLGWEVYAAAAWYLVSRRGVYARWMKYVSAGADALFLTLILVLVEGNNGPLGPMYYVLIIESALRYSRRAIFAAAGFSAAADLRKT